MTIMGYLKLKLRHMRNIASCIRFTPNNVTTKNYIVKPKIISKDFKIGYYCYIGKGAKICPRVEFANYVMAADDLAILGGDHNYNIPGHAVIFSGRPSLKKTVIQDDVWIGERVIINAGVTVGRGAIIGAGSIVTKDIEPYTINVGVPTKKIRERFSKKDILIHDAFLKMTPMEGDYASKRR